LAHGHSCRAFLPGIPAGEKPRQQGWPDVGSKSAAGHFFFPAALPGNLEFLAARRELDEVPSLYTPMFLHLLMNLVATIETAWLVR
jgi:hypothetical protein